jgi:hypothetical protein
VTGGGAAAGGGGRGGGGVDALGLGVPVGDSCMMRGTRRGKRSLLSFWCALYSI